jgi:folylpolyglutamate synthase/dihydrofolate synthase
MYVHYLHWSFQFICNRCLMQKKLITSALGTKVHWSAFPSFCINKMNYSSFTPSPIHSQPCFQPNDEFSYEKTIQALDSLILKQPKTHRPPDTRQPLNVQAMNDYLNRLQLKIEDMPPVIHVAGTKGKGSTCFFCESILRHCGYKTGLFTSPHLIDVRERIRINGEPVSKEVFMRNFWYCYKRLMHTTNDVFPSMATYFRFLTVLALKIFAEEGVQVSILEVGVGGIYCSTNVFPRPLVCGITSIGMDHIDLLGENIDQIAIQKAGIMKPDCVCITMQNQKDIVKRAFWNFAQADAPDFYKLFLSQDMLHYYNMYPELKKCKLVTENIEKNKQDNAHKNPLYEANWEYFSNIPKEAGNNVNNLLNGGIHQQMNAALAIALCETFIYLNDRNAKNVLSQDTVKLIEERLEKWSQVKNKTGMHVQINNEPFQLEPYKGNSLSEPFIRGLLECVCPGRGHVFPFVSQSVYFYLDGAHTEDSIYYCTEWFKKKCSEPFASLSNPINYQPMMMSSIDNDANGYGIEEAQTLNRKEEHPVVNILVFNYTGTRQAKDLLEPLISESHLFNYVIFLPMDSQKISLSKRKVSSEDTDTTDPQTLELRDLWIELSNIRNNSNKKQEVMVMDSISTFIEWVFHRGHARVLVTGSFYLVGDFLRKLRK